MLQVREPQPGIAWSQRRIARRAAYDCWMWSPQWLEVRRRWRREWIRRNGGEPACAVCAGEWSLTSGDLHHRTYSRLGHERFEDLVALDRLCHDRVHRIWDANPAWRRLDRSLANDLIVGMLRRSFVEERLP